MNRRDFIATGTTGVVLASTAKATKDARTELERRCDREAQASRAVEDDQ